MNDQSNIERVVMRRVHTVRFLRPVLSGGACAALILVLALWGIGREVWVARVFENMPRGSFYASLRFWFSAFDHTRLIVQALALFSLAALIYLARETARLFTGVLSPLRA